MKFFSGFCLNLDKNFFSEYVEDREFVVAGFSYGAQKAVDYVLNSNKRVDKLQLLSPAFFDYNQKLIELNLSAFRKDKNSYIKNFLTKAGADEVIFDYLDYSCDENDLYKLFTFDWEKIKELKGIKLEIFLGEFDRIIALKKAYSFFREYGEIYFIKKADHFLRS